MAGPNDPTDVPSQGADPDATLLPDGTAAAPGAPALTAGASVSRYTVIEKIGQGAMGVVFAAWDPELDRRVALKLVQADIPSAGARAQLLREAKALAKLSHPGVVTVYDVGTWGDALFIAMEYLRGETLEQWQAHNAGAAWTRVVETYMHAGAGLAAAHDVGLIHRDFKPANVMVTEAGDVKVLDFGLAAAGDGTLQRRAGTPRYMAPEQHTGEELDARCDQFSLCVALYEALFDEHPFGGGSTMQVALAVQAGALQPAPRATAVAPKVRAAIMRGLSTEPDERFPSMAALLGALDPHAVSRRRQRWFLGGTALLVVGAAAALVAGGEPPCTGAAEPIDRVWNHERRATIDAALHGGDTDALAATATATAIARFDRFAQDWVAQRQEACSAAKVTHAQTEAAMELRYHCLDERLDRFAGLLAPLEHATRSDRLGLATTLEAVPALERCADLEVLRALFPPPEDPGTRARVRALYADLAKLEADVDMKLDERVRQLEAWLPRADALGHPPLQLDMRHTLGSSLAFAGRVSDGLSLLEEAVELGLRSGAHEQTASVLLELARLRASHLAEVDGALLLVRIAESIAATVPEHEHIQDRVHSVRLQIHQLAHDGEAAESEARLLIDRIREAGDLQDPRGVEARSRLGFILTMNDKHDEAETMLASVLDAPTIGDGHPLIASAYVYRARLRDGQEKYDEALADHQAAHDRFLALYGPNHPNTAGRLVDMAKTLGHANRLEEAARTARKGVQQMLVGHEDGPDARLVVAYEQLAGFELNLGNLDEATTALDRAEHWQRGLTGSTGDPVFARVARGRIAEERGRPDAARVAYDLALRVATSDEERLEARVGLALATVEDGELATAQVELEQLREHPELGALSAARLTYISALLEHRRGQDQTARRYIQEARERLAAIPDQRMLARKLDALEAALSD